MTSNQLFNNSTIDLLTGNRLFLDDVSPRSLLAPDFACAVITRLPDISELLAEFMSVDRLNTAKLTSPYRDDLAQQVDPLADVLRLRFR